MREIKKMNCVACGKRPLTRNELGINKKLLGADTKIFFCLDCLAAHLEVDVQDILEKIEEFRAEGCKLFR